MKTLKKISLAVIAAVLNVPHYPFAVISTSIRWKRFPVWFGRYWRGAPWVFCLKVAVCNVMQFIK